MYVLGLAFGEIMDEPLIAVYLRVTLLYFHHQCIGSIHLFNYLFISYLIVFETISMK